MARGSLSLLVISTLQLLSRSLVLSPLRATIMSPKAYRRPAAAGTVLARPAAKVQLPIAPERRLVKVFKDLLVKDSREGVARARLEKYGQRHQGPPPSQGGLSLLEKINILEPVEKDYLKHLQIFKDFLEDHNMAPQGPEAIISSWRCSIISSWTAAATQTDQRP